MRVDLPAGRRRTGRLPRACGEHAAGVPDRGRGGRGGRRPGGGRRGPLRRAASAGRAGRSRGGGAGRLRRACAVPDVGGRSTGAGAAWACYDDCGCRGAVPDAGEHPVRRHGGRRRARGAHGPGRAGEGSSLPTTPGRLRRRARMLTRPSTRSMRPDRDRRPAGPTTRPARGPVTPTAPGRRWSSAHSRTPRRGGCASTTSGWSPWRWRCPISRCATRRCGRCAGPGTDLDGAEHLWAALVRETPDPEAAEPAALLAACARCCAATGRWPRSRWTGPSRPGPGTASAGCCARSGPRGSHRNGSATA